jgi:hypothetical protein
MPPLTTKAFDLLDQLLIFLTLIVALSAYLGTVRLFGLERLRELSDELWRLKDGNQKETVTRLEQKQRRTKVYLALLLFADVPMTISAALLAVYIFGLFNYPAPSWPLRWSIYLFTAAGLALFCAHLYGWIRTLKQFTVRLDVRRNPS